MSKRSKFSDHEVVELESSSEGSVHENNELNRALQPRHVNMIAIAGIIGTGLFLGTGKSLHGAGPASLLITYCLIGAVVYLVMLCLGEMSTYMPIAGSFCTYAKRYGSDSFGFTILVNYWFNDAVSVASDLTALQLVLKYWTTFHFWIVSLIFWIFLLFLNVFHVRFYGETEYWLAILKVVAIIAFFIVSILVNVGVNREHKYIGFKNWTVDEAPFVNHFKGFANCFVTASFAYGGLESITLTGGETKNPVRTTPKVIKTTVYRILIFYVFTVFFIGMNVPYNFPGLATKSVITSPFTIVFTEIGSKGAGSFMNAVIMTSVISAGNHALFAGSRLLYTLGTEGYLPKVFTLRNRYKTPWVAVLVTWLAGGLCFGSSFIGTGTLWNWLQNLVGVSNQLAWLCIGITSIRFRKGLAAQGKTHQLSYVNWTYPWGPWFVVVFVSFIILVQGWSSFAPWDVSSFFSFYVELFVFPLFFLVWWLWKRDPFVSVHDMDFETDRYIQSEEEILENERLDSLKGSAKLRQFISDYFI